MSGIWGPKLGWPGLLAQTESGQMGSWWHMVAQSRQFRVILLVTFCQTLG
jgi:hypothetical protein